MGPEGSSPWSQEPATCPYPSRMTVVHIVTPCLFKIHFNIILPYTCRSYNWFLQFHVSTFCCMGLSKESVQVLGPVYGLLVTCPNPKLQHHPLSALRNMFNLFAHQIKFL
jgi:hypothetical protein